MSSESVCVICKKNGDKVIAFVEKTLKKSHEVLEVRKHHGLKYNDIVLPVIPNLTDGYHRICYKNFIALMKKYIENTVIGSNVSTPTKVHLMSRKWRNVKDYYLKEKRLEEKGCSRVRRKRECNYFKILEFIDQNPKYDKTEINANQNSTNNLGNESDSNSQEFITQSIPEEIEVKSETPETPPSERSRRESTSTSQTPLLMSTERPQNKSQSTSVRDFLLSLTPDVESLTNKQYMEFRLGVLSLLNNIMFDNNSTNESWVISTIGNTTEFNK